jgi:uncharacterized protein (UPF0335 family)
VKHYKLRLTINQSSKLVKNSKTLVIVNFYGKRQVVCNKAAINIIKSVNMSEVIEAEKLKQIIHKIENIEQEKVEASDLLKDVFNEAKSMGFDVKIIKHVIKLRKKDKNALAEEDSLIELYRGALGV